MDSIHYQLEQMEVLALDLPGELHPEPEEIVRIFKSGMTAKCLEAGTGNFPCLNVAAIRNLEEKGKVPKSLHIVFRAAEVARLANYQYFAIIN